MEIKFNNVNFSYFADTPFSVEVIKNLSVSIFESKITGIIGQSGSGKSTLLKLMAGVLKPTSGIITGNRNVGILLQSPEKFFFWDTVYEEIYFNLKKNKIKGKNLLKHISDALKMVGLNDNYLQRSPLELSRGEQKKVALASLLAVNPKILLLDEPLIGLDVSSQKKMIRLFRMLKVRYGKTIIIASNDSDFLHEMCDDIMLFDGKVISYDDKYSIFSNKNLLISCNVRQPKIMAFIQLVKDKKGINLEWRDDVNDVMKDIYRFVK
jgi:energy-coupling factor transport system ATP-binding protein